MASSCLLLCCLFARLRRSGSRWYSPMKIVTACTFADPETAVRKLFEIANVAETGQDG